MSEKSTRPGRLQAKINWYLSLLALFLLVTLPPMLCALFYLSQTPDISWERDDHVTYDRIWMYRERRPLGIGYQSQRIVAEYSQTEVCVQTNLRFFLWGQSKEAEAAESQRMLVLIDDQWQPNGEMCR